MEISIEDFKDLKEEVLWLRKWIQNFESERAMESLEGFEREQRQERYEACRYEEDFW